MKKMAKLNILIFLAIPVFILGCSNGGAIRVDLMPDGKITTYIGAFEEGLLGLFLVTLDTDSLEIKSEPVHSRTVNAVGDIFFDLEITDFMIFPYCPDETCLMVGGVGVVDDSSSGDSTPDITFDISLKHPFQQYNSSLPPTSLNRADLDIFNPKVYIINAGNQNPLVTDSEAGRVTDTGITNPLTGTSIHTNLNFVQNADGWNSLADGKSVNPTGGLTPEELATLLTYQIPDDYPGTDCHPYLNFFYGNESDGGTNNPKSGDCRISQGEAAEKRVVQLNVGPGEGEIKFMLAVSASYGQSAKGRPNRVPSSCRYFIPAFNTHNPIITSLSVIAPVIGTATDGSITVKIRDMQSGSTGVAASIAAYTSQADGGKLLPPEVINYADISFPKITGLTLNDYLVGGAGELVYRPQDIDGNFLSGELTIAGSDATGTGSVSDPFIFQIPLPYATYSPAGVYRVCFIVKDGLCKHPSGAFPNKWDLRWVQFTSRN